VAVDDQLRALRMLAANTEFHWTKQHLGSFLTVRDAVLSHCGSLSEEAQAKAPALLASRPQKLVTLDS
jgi:hypothetical protein